MRKVSLFLVLFLTGLLAFGGSAIAWDWGTSAYSSISSSTFTPTATSYSSSTASAFTCGLCGTAEVGTFSTSYAGESSFSSSASAYAFSISSIICDEPPVCEDGDDDGVCDESDNCEFDPNTDQVDSDDDQIGDVCDECPDDATNTCNDPEPPCVDIDNDTLCDDSDDCLDTAPGAIIDAFGCEIPPICESGQFAYTGNGPWDDNGVYVGAGNGEYVCTLESCDDADQDEVCDADDVCPDMDDNSLECQLEQACPCDNDWQNHGAYVTCIVAFEQAHSQEDGIGDVVSEAGRSDCGGPHSGSPLP